MNGRMHKPYTYRYHTARCPSCKEWHCSKQTERMYRASDLDRKKLLCADCYKEQVLGEVPNVNIQFCGNQVPYKEEDDEYFPLTIGEREQYVRSGGSE